MGVLGEATVKIRADTANFHKDASRGVLSSIDSVGKDAESRAKKTFGAIGTAAKVAGAAGFIALGFAVKDVVSDFLEDDKAARQTAAVLKSTGGVANVTAGHVEKLATAIRNKTGIDDAAIAGGENMLLTFTKVRNETGKGNAIFDQATRATANLSVAMGKDMTSSAMLVGKALNDPIKGMSALSRAGIQFTDQQKDTIKQMVATGDTMGAQKIILKELETQFGGSAEAAGKSLGGQLNILKGRLEDVGGVIVAKVMPYLLRFVSFINENMPTIERVVGTVFSAIGTAFTALGTAIGFIQSQFQQNRQTIETVMNAIRTAVTAAFDFISNTVIPGAINAWARYGPAITTALATAVSAVKTAVGAIQVAIDYIRTTVIPAALAAWATYGPRIQQAFADVISIIRTAAGIIAGIISQVQQNWDRIWGLIGPTVVMAFQVVRTAIQTAFLIITGLIHAFAAALRGDWGEAWNALKGVAAAALAGVVSIVGSILRGLAGTAKALASNIGEAIAAGIKSAAGHLAGLAGDLSGKIRGAVSQAAGSAFAYARQVGFAIADGVISGVGDLAGRLKDKVVSAAKTAMSWGGKILHGSGDWMFTKQVVGMPMVQGIIDGVTAKQAELNAAMTNTVSEAGEHGGRGVEGVTAKMTTIFDAWVTNVKAKVAAGFDAAHAKIDAEFAKAQARLDKWKTEMTPTEALLASMQANAALAQVQGAVTAARTALDALDAKFVADWAKLLADQAKNLAKLKATQAVTETDEAIAGHEFSQTLAGADPMAIKALEARKALDTAKQLYAEHKISQDELFAAQDAWDAASLAAADSTNAQKLLQDYDTWQGLVKQAAEGAAGIVTQEATDAETRATAIAGYSEARKTASQGVYDALLEQQKFYLEEDAKRERTAHDAKYEELKEALKKRHDKNETHIDNIEKMWDRHFKAIIKQAKEDGKKFTDAYVDAIDDVAKPGGLLETSAGKLATVLKKYLKLNSPAEKGPLSDLDRWWTKLAPTLLSSLDGSSIKAALSDAVTPMSGGFAPGAADSARQQTLSLNDGALIGKVTELVDVLRKKDAPLGVTVLASGGAQAAVIAARR